jgi:hypothetical protein
MKQKNNFQQILGVSFLVLVFAAIVSVVYWWQSSHGFNMQPTYHPSQQKITYHNPQYNFDLTYPKSYTIDDTGSQENYFKSGGKTLTTISIPRETFPNTNLTEANITWAVKEKSTAKDCAIYVTSGGETKTMKNTVKLESYTYYTADFTGAAAGTAYQTKIYRALSHGTCYEANLTVGIANIGNYPPGTVSEVTEADVWNSLSCILVSFKLN